MIVRQMMRELRSMKHHLIVLIGAIAMGVTAMTSIHALGDSIRDALSEQSRPMLAGDVIVRSMHPFPEQLIELRDEDSSSTKELFSMARNQSGESLLCEVKAIDGGYPLYGELHTSLESSISETLNEQSVLVEPSLLTRLSLKEGDSIWLNSKQYTIAGQVLEEPDRSNIGISAGPRIMMNFAGLERSGLEKFGSRITRKIQFRTNEIASLEKRLEAIQGNFPALRIQGGSKGNPTAERGVANTENFLLMVGFLSVVIAIIGVTQSILVWLRGRQQAIATYRCMGMTPFELLRIFMGAIFLLTLSGAIIGLFGAYVGLYLLFQMIEPYLPFSMTPSLSYEHIVHGIGIALSSSLIAALYPLRRLISIPPLAAMRLDVQPAPISWQERTVFFLIFSFLLGALAAWQLQSWFLGFSFVLGAGILIAILLLAANVCAYLLGRIPIRSWVFRHAFASFRRPGLGVSSAMVALGMGTMITLSIALMQERLSDQLGDVHPQRAPTAFFVDIQTDQKEEVLSLFQKNDGRYIQTAPVVMGRLSVVNGESIAQKIEADPEQSWAFTREQRLSFDVYIDPKTIISGDWDTDPSPNDLCLEQRYAERLGLSVGDRVIFDVQGIPLSFHVRALRRIEWQSFNLNFFLVGRAELLEEAPKFILGAAQFTPENEEKLQKQLVSIFPNITVISVRAIVEKASILLKSLAFAVQGMGIFSAGVGLLILIGSIRTSMIHRSKQFALFRALGTSRLEQRLMLIVEFTILGFVASSLGGSGAYLLCSLLFQYVFLMTPMLHWELIFLWIVGLTGLTVFVGLWTAQHIVRTSVWMELKQ